MDTYVIEIIKNGKEMEFVNNFRNIMKDCHIYILMEPSVTNLVIKYDLFFSNIDFFSKKYKFDTIISYIDHFYGVDKNYVENNIFSLLKYYKSEIEYVRVIMYCKEKNIVECDKIDLYNLFKSDLCIIKLCIVGKKYPNDSTRAYLGKLGNSLEKQYKRLDFVNVLIQHPQRLCFENALFR